MIDPDDHFLPPLKHFAGEQLICLRHESGTRHFTIDLLSNSHKQSDVVLALQFNNPKNIEKSLRKALANKQVDGEKRYELTRRDWIWLHVAWGKYIVHQREPEHVEENGLNPYCSRISKLELDDYKENEKARDFKKRHSGFKSIVIPFGKYKGKKLWTTIEKDKGYFEWLSESRNDTDHAEFFNAIYEKLGTKPPVKLEPKLEKEPVRRERLYAVTVEKILHEADGFNVLGVSGPRDINRVILNSNDIPKPLKTVKYDFSGNFRVHAKHGKQFVADRWSRTPKQKTSSEIRAVKEASRAKKYI